MSSEAAAGGSTTVIETVEFRATAPATRLPGLDNAQRKLEALSAAIKQVQSQLAGIGTNSMFKLSPQQYANFAYDKDGKLSAGIGTVARRAGFGPEAVKDIRQSANRMVSEVHAAIGKIEREIARNPGFKKRALEARQQQIQDLKNFLPFTGTKGNPASSFKGSGVAGMFFGGGLAGKLPKLPKGFSFSGPTRAFIERGYAGEALANQNHFKDVLRGLLSGSVHDNGPAFHSQASVAAQVAQAIKEAKVKPEDSGSSGGGGKKGKGKGKGGGTTAATTGGEDGEEEERVLVPKGGPVVERRVEQTPGGKDRTTTTSRQGLYETESALEVEGKVLKLTSREMTEKETADTLRQNLTNLKKRYARELLNPPASSGKGKGFQGGYEKLRSSYSSQATEMFAEHEMHQPMLDQFLNETLPATEQKEMTRVADQRKKLLKKRYAAEQKDDKLKRANIQAELDSLEDHRKALGKFNQSGQRAAKDIAREQKKTGAFDLKNQTSSAFKTATTQAAMDLEADLIRRGAKLHKLNEDQLTGRKTGATYQIEENGRLNKYRVDYNKEGDATARMTSSLKPMNKNHDRLDQALEGLTMRNMAANLVKVTAWSAAVMVLYKAAELAGYSMRRMEQTGLEMAHLDVVFRGVGGTVQELTTDMMKLASTEGRATSEAMESAQSWARLGGDRKTINEEVRVSAEAANIANMHMAETSKQLQSLMHIYHLEAADLDGTLGGLVATSLRYNVTLEEMFTGLDRSAAAARVAGISLAELQGMLAVVTGTTGATGSTTGNALKYVFQELNKSDVQQTLRERYKVETLDKNLNQKPVGQTLGELSGIWGTLGDRSKQMLGGTLGGRFNAARVPVVIEQYPEILKQAIDSQLGLNAAQTANAKILDTVKANMAGLRAEYDRLIMSGNVLAKVNMGAALGRGLMHDAANLFTGPAPSDAQQLARRNEMTANMTAHPFWSQAAGIGRTLTRNVMPWMRNLGMTGPGMVEYFNLMHEEQPEGRMASSSRLEGFRKQERASALRGQSLGIAKTMLGNGTMTDVNANIFAETMRGMGPAGVANAADFLKARGANDTQGALAAVGRASGQAFSERQKALEEKQLMFSQEATRIKAAAAANEKEITDGGKDATPAQIQKRDELSRQLLKNRDDVDALDGAYQELEGTVDTVQITQQKYLDLLKTQEGLLSGIEERYKMVEGHTAMQKLGQEIAAFTAQQATAHQWIADFDATGDKTPEGLAARGRMVDEDKKLQAAKAAAIARTGQAAGLTAEQHGVEGSENTARAVNYGYNETAKLLRVRDELNKDAVRTQEQLGLAVAGTAEYEELTGRYAKDNALAYEHTLDLARRRADVEAEIHQLAIDQNREFSRSFFGAGAADMLRKLAAFKLALGGGVTQGQLYSMGPAMRQDVGSLTGMNPDMARLLRERNTLSANGFASGGYTGDGPADEIAGVVHRGEFVIPRGGVSGEESTMDDYPVRKSGERNRLPHGERLQVWRNYYEDQFEKDNRQPAGSETLSGNQLGTESGMGGYVSQRQRDMLHTSMVAKAAALPTGLAAMYGAARLAMRGGGNPAPAASPAVARESLPKARPAISAATSAMRRRYQDRVAAWERAESDNYWRQVEQRYLFQHSHSSLRLGGSPESAPGSFHPMGLAMDDMDEMHGGPSGGGWKPKGTTFSQAVTNLNNGTPAATRGLASRGWTAARGFLSSPKTWANLARGAAGGAVTAGLDWAGGSVSPMLRNSDTATGALWHVGTDAAGGAVAGGAGGAAAAAAIGLGARVAGGLHGLGHQWVDADKTYQQVSAAQQARLQRQRAAAEAPGASPVHRVAAIQHDDSALARRSTAAMAAADAQMARWHDLKRPPAKPIMGSNGKPAAINPATGLPLSSGTDHSLEGRPAHVAAAHAAAAKPAPNNAAVMPAVRPAAVSGGGGRQTAATDDTAIKNATAALDMLTTTAGKLNTAFAALATRADALFKGGGNGLQFAPTGQMGGSYPGKH